MSSRRWTPCVNRAEPISYLQIDLTAKGIMSGSGHFELTFCGDVNDEFFVARPGALTVEDEVRSL
jgi:hypothetical protein